MEYKVIIVDDEEVGRLRLRRLISDNFYDFRIIAEASNGISGIETIQKNRPDLVFLDIEMPGISGIEVAKSCCSNIFVIFVTAFDKYVLDAFKTLAVDYILKPIDIDNLRVAINKFKQIYSPFELTTIPNKPLLESEPMNKTGRLKITIGKTIKFLVYDEIVYFEAFQKYTSVFTVDSKSYITDLTLQELEISLPSAHFIRIHRKHIVNEHYIKEIKRLGDRKFNVILKPPLSKVLSAGRHYLSNILKIR